jgi:hypothetical protein
MGKRKLYEGLYFYKLDVVYYITDSNDKIQTTDFETLREMKNYHKINKNIFQGFEEDNIETLIRFRDTYNSWCKQIHDAEYFEKNGKKYRLLIKSYASLQHAIYRIIKNFSKIKFDGLFEPVKDYEFLILEQCYNAGLMTFDENYENKPTQIYGYDFNSEYPNTLVHLSIPKKPGKMCILDEIDYKNLKFGVYRVCVYSKNKDFKKIFSFCKDNHYTSRQLKELYKYKDKFEISFELLPPDEDHDYNALIYENDFLNSENIFGDWLKNLTKIKEKCKGKERDRDG